MKEITKEEHERILCLYYGAEYEYTSTDEDGEYKRLGTFNGNCNIGAVLSVSPKLRLTPLSDITEEHAERLLEIATYHPQIHEDYENIISDIDIVAIVRLPDRIKITHSCICFEGMLTIESSGAMYFEEEDGAKEFVWNAVAVIDKLREWGYMLPAYGIQDLFEAGIAVRKEGGKG